jgi:hypothetical protein
MKTMIATDSKVRRGLSLLGLSMMITLFVSCNNDEAAPESPEDDQENVTFDSMDDYYFDDADEMVTIALGSETSAENGRLTSDARLNCAQLSFSGDVTSGSLTVDFGTGCEDAHGNIRKGAIVVERHGTSDTEGSHWSFTFADYSINGVTVEGTRIATVISVADSLIVSDVTLVGGKITWPDGRIARREANRRRHHERHENNLLDRLIIYGNAQGTWCNGRGYFIEIIEPLVYSRSCASAGVIIPVAGKKLIKHGEREVTVDYGDGSCDSIVTLTYKNGKTIRYEVN